MDNLNTCPSCDAEVRAGAKFCDNCGADIGSAATTPQAEEAAPKAGVKLLPIVILIVIIAGAWWLLSNDDNKAPDMPVVASGGGTSADNPHGGVDMGGGGADGDMGSDMMAQIADAKEHLGGHPDDIESLSYLYQTFGMIGRGTQLAEDGYIDNALAAIEANEAQYGDDLQKMCIQLAMAAAQGGDPEASEAVYDKLIELRPDYKVALKLKGDLKASMGLWEEALAGYDAYLAIANDLDDGQDYWSALSYKARIYLERFAQATEGEGDPDDMAQAQQAFQALTVENPFYFHGWFGLGDTYEQLGDTDQAIEAWEKAASVAMDDNDKWAAEVKVAGAKGEELPPVPDGAMGGSSGGMDGGESMSNPHGGMGGADMGGSESDEANPHGGM